MSVRPLGSSWSQEFKRQAQAEKIHLGVLGINKLSKATILDEITKGMHVNREEKKSTTKFSGNPKVKRSGIQSRKNVQTNLSEDYKKVNDI